jgi:hypothetical protein
MKRNSWNSLGVTIAGVLLAASVAAGDSLWRETDNLLGQAGKPQPGEVQKYSWPRRDLRVSIDGVAIQPALALGSWAAFHGSGPESMVMGDLVLLGPEVNSVVVELQSGGFEILALHNHLIGESPRLLYLHYMGKGIPVALAKTLWAALSKTKTPVISGPATRLTEAEAKILDSAQASLGRKGSLTGGVLQIGVPRSDPITDGGMEIPASMGMAETINVEPVGARVATTGDFVLAADEVNPVIRELESHGVEVTALHSHMLRESPRLFFLHFWGVGPPEKIGEGLKAALSHVAVKP